VIEEVFIVVTNLPRLRLQWICIFFLQRQSLVLVVLLFVLFIFIVVSAIETAAEILFFVVRLSPPIERVRFRQRGIIVVISRFKEPHPKIIFIVDRRQRFLRRQITRYRWFTIDGLFVQFVIVFDPVVFQIRQRTRDRLFQLVIRPHVIHRTAISPSTPTSSPATTLPTPLVPHWILRFTNRFVVRFLDRPNRSTVFFHPRSFGTIFWTTLRPLFASMVRSTVATTPLISLATRPRTVALLSIFTRSRTLRAARCRTLLHRPQRPISSADLANETAPFEVTGVNIRDVQEPVSADPKINKRCLNARLDIHNLSRVNVADDVLARQPLNIQFFKNSLFNDRNAGLLGENRVNEHDLLHSMELSVRTAIAP
jgi:hypothetical protein